MATTTFFFKAVASDGKVRTGTIAAETDRLVAQELNYQRVFALYEEKLTRPQ